ncbi:MAG: ZPR1 zinc finger domain-containing protein [Methanobrevibacter sp.]|uniref:ZPR1 zinc finger domain-containing protein n=1 Tax=Methanobrevibacter sp. TaxID=66852 RepID=UPI0025E6B641|nr:ZPR1 zinc finger domain-containing protein [Methanobrevibacter sp.]MBQ8018481.1 ZPR1 zinc finger domain-containing protein [Methanobrevibacter sp.]
MNDETINEMIIKCPACGIEGVAKSIMKEIEIPHFGKVMETTIQCPSCGFKHSDIIALEQNDPAKYVLEINRNNLSIRVVRSQSATVIIPELGVKVEPGPKSEGYVTNVEGVLTRFESAVKKALNLFDDAESQKNANNILNQIQELKKGNGTATLIILDPFGQSNIVSENVEILEIPEEELSELKTGFSHIEDN